MSIARIVSLTLGFCGSLGSALAAQFVSGSYAPVNGSTQVNLSQQGAIDWVQFGYVPDDTGSDDIVNTGTWSNIRKSTPASQVGQYASYPNARTFRHIYGPNSIPAFSWTDGDDPEAVSDAHGSVYTDLGSAGVNGSGIQLTVASSTAELVLKLYLGVYHARGTLSVGFGNFSTALYTDSSLQDPAGVHSQAGTHGVYTLRFENDQTADPLTIRWTQTYVDTYPRVMLDAATLSHVPEPSSIGVVVLGGAVLLKRRGRGASEA